MAVALDIYPRRRRWIPLLAAVGFSAYGAYKVYHLPSISRKRRQLSRLVGTLISISEAAASSAETVSLVSSDLSRFLRSDSDELPTSLKQISKIARSDEFSGSVSRVSAALTIGILRGARSGAEADSAESGVKPGSSFSDRVLDKLFSSAGSGFASVVVGSFARNLVMAFYSGGDSGSLRPESEPGWVDLICGDKLRELIGGCIQLFVSTAVAVYLDKTMDINTYDEFFAGLTNPKHESKVRDTLVTVCDAAIGALVKTSHQVLSVPNSDSSSKGVESIDQGEEFAVGSERASLHNPKSKESGGWADRVSSTLAVPSNRRLVIDVAGRVTFETVRSFLDFLVSKLYDGATRSINVVREEVVERGLVVVRYTTAKSMVIVTICIALCMHVLSGARVLMPA